MSETMKSTGQGAMMIPKSILFTTIKGAITSGQDEKIQDLTDLLYGSMEGNVSLGATVALQSNRLDQQHQEIMSLVETVKEGFRQIDKRFEQVNKQFSIMMWAIGIGFTVVVAFMGATAGFFR